ncbi:uncharacterized protein JN550_002754 [Neoarthrinium moseri]|uniref:uncharacterized protein n=1 Tax=Neoarthrinium moseri TaxID=1658444 RepID=UPI001FDAFC10|nr:uncharacterized protein JN550_002754 [Neoarthrinium moseri]KAI1874175.1 hypothetical protein JN550_002754 [Neoarthrinium moseri]
MADSLDGQVQSSRRSCENCRRKKTKCTGERPVCSFCQRLQQKCYYLPRDRKRSQDTDFGVHQKKWALKRRTPTPSVATGRSPGRRGEINSPAKAVGSAWVDTENDLLSNMLDLAVTVHDERMNFQPISLFCPRVLRDTLAKAPHFLQWTFLSLSIMYLGSDTPDLSTREAVKRHSASARVVVTQLAAEGTPKLEISQCLCLIALAHILAGEGGLAWMTLGLASRLEVLRISQQEQGEPGVDSEASSRCYWSIRSLENVFAPQSIPRLQDLYTPAYPTDMQAPEPVIVKTRQQAAYDLAFMDDECIQGSGIYAHSIRVMASWRDVSKYLHSIRHGNIDKPWLPTSKFAELTQQLYELENNLDYKHCFRNARLNDRSLDALHKDREYWRCWMLYQLRFHACSALLNHPFVHLVALRSANRSSAPRSFLQITVDQALYHSSWVIRLINMCLEVGFSIYDPFTSDIVVAVATVPWIMQYARDSKVAARSKENLSQCRNFLSTLSQLWPRVVQKLATLDQLQSLTDCAAAQNTISFEPAQLWQLLDPSITELSAQRNASSLSASDRSTTMRVHTTFIHPLVEKEGADEVPKVASETPFPLGLPGDTSQQFLFDDFFMQPLNLDQVWIDL